MPGADLETRLARLERSNRNLRRLLAGLALVAAVPLLAAYVPANDKLEAGEFIVRDKSGAVRVRLFVDDQGKARVVLRDEQGRSTANLSSGDGASLTLGDKSDKSKVVISASPSARDVVSVESDGKSKSILWKHKGWEMFDPLDAQDPWAVSE